MQFGCEVPDFDPTAYLGAKEARRIDRVTQLGFAAAADALADAGDVDADPGAVRGRSSAPASAASSRSRTKCRCTSRRAPLRVSPFFVPMMMANATAGTIAMQFGWTGPNLCISTACAASAHAIGEAARLIRDGSADVVMTGGTESCLTAHRHLRVRAHDRAQRRATTTRSTRRARSTPTATAS